MKHWRPGLSVKFALLIASALMVLLLAMLLMYQRERTMQREVIATGGESMRALAIERMRKRGGSDIAMAADALVNPMYYFDLDQIGAIARKIMQQPDVSYVLVYDNAGNILHDGSGDIPTYGRAMSDPLAYEVVSASGPHMQWTDQLLDISRPIAVGADRLGGVRIGYSLQSAWADEGVATGRMAQRLNQIGKRHLQWIVLVLLTLSMLALVLGVLIQRTLVRPIRQLATAAREIEAGNFSAVVPQSRRGDEIGDLMRAFGHMGSSIERHNRDIRRMAYTDPLTGLANRLAFRENLDRQAIQHHGAARQMALLFADIDDFKRVNDSFGHDVGDEVLVQFASRIRSAVESYGGADAMLARFGGDEFVILLQTEAGDSASIRGHASQLADRLVAELSRPLQVHDRQLFLGTSIGITVFPDDAGSASMLMKNGDIAMYQAKLAGKNCYRFYSRAMDQALLRRERMETDLRGAWERGELTLAYQPIYRLSGRELVGAEALLRWQHAHDGAISPSTFIDVAEQSGLIEQIGPEVLRQACRDAVSWRWRGRGERELFVSVNVSARQLRSGELPHQVAGALQESGLAATCLHLELTETAVITDEQAAVSLLSQLRERGIKVWLDDFGTGFSGLSQLRQVPVDGVKIDRSFISELGVNSDDLALTSAIIAMGHSLGVTLIAEGVETEQQYQLLMERGCDLGQGYWLGVPLTQTEFARLLD